MDFSEDLLTLRRSLKLTQAEMAARLGITSNYVSLLEKGAKEPSDSILRLVELVKRVEECGLGSGGTVPREEPASFGSSKRERRVPVVGWAHAGQAATYEELPHDWQEMIPTDCRDERAFGVNLEGDSMEPGFKDGDLLVLMPSEEIYSGCFAVARFANDGVLFRRIEMSGASVRLIPLNERYSISEHHLTEFSWMYPVWGSWRQLWKR